MSVYHHRGGYKNVRQNHFKTLVVIAAFGLSMYGMAHSWALSKTTEAGRGYQTRKHSIGYMKNHTYHPLLGLDSNGNPASAQTQGAGQASPGGSQPASGLLHTGITATLFWVGEGATDDNGHISNAASAWDETWSKSYGGIDDPYNRSGFLPKGFTPKENPFYFALPYNDFSSSDKRKASAASCPGHGSSASYSWCKNSWVKIMYGGKTVYAQWEDVGPFGEDDSAYVFGTAKPSNGINSRAGIDLSPAANGYLGLGDVATVDWQFISAADVPSGPWKNIVTTSPGSSY